MSLPASTVISPVADALKGILASIGASPAVKAWKWTPADLGRCPAGVVELPAVDRRGVDEAESQVGSRDFYMHFPVTLYVDLREPAASQEQAVQLLEAFINAVDVNPSLGVAGVLDAVVSSAQEPELAQDRQKRPLLAYETTVSLLRLV